MTSLKKQATQGAFWSSVESFGQQGVQFIVGIILARILEPEDFGLMGMIFIFLALAQSLVNSGFGTALIQKQDASHEDESTVFWFNLGAGLAVGAALFISAPWIAVFYKTPLLEPITKVLSVNCVIVSFGIVHTALLAKALNFKARMVTTIIAIGVAGGVGVSLAVFGFGVWSLVVQSMMFSAVQCLGLWCIHPWRPLWVFRISSLQALFGFGSKMLASGLLNTFFDNLYMVIIGKVYSVADLGFYHRGKRLTQLISQSLAKVMGQVSYPLLSKMQGDLEVMKRTLEKILQTIMAVNFPMMIGLGIVAQNFILVLLGEKWLPCVPYFQLFCIIGISHPIHVLNLNVIAALGRSDLFFRLECIKKGLIVINVLMTFKYGVLALLWGHVVCSLGGLLINVYYVRQFLEYGFLEQLHSIHRSMVATITMAASILLLGFLPWTFRPILELSVQTFLGGVVYCTMAWVLKDPGFDEWVSCVTTKWKPKKI